MPQFFFHLRDESGFSRDADGLDFPDLERAYLEGCRAVIDLKREYTL